MALSDSKFITKDGAPVGGVQPVKSTASGEDYIDLDTLNDYLYSAGRISWSTEEFTALVDTGFANVRNAIGQENHVIVYNDTGVQIDNGTVCNASGIDSNKKAFTVIKADASNAALSSAVVGVATMDIPDGEYGLVTKLGDVNGIDTSALSEGGLVYLSDTTPGALTNTRPKYPSIILIVGSAKKSDATTGRLFVDITRFMRTSINQSYSFTSQGISAGTYWKGGFYKFATTSVTLTNASTTQTYGTAGKSYAAHPAVVASGPGTVNTGQVGLRVSGIKDSETGTQTAGQTEVITDDITTLTTNQYAETVGKFSGQVTFELYVVSGSPTSYSLSFNYGFSKYDDFGNRDFTVDYFEAVWLGAGNDSSFDIALMHHKSTGWTYSASSFVPGNGDICRKSVDQALAGNVTVNGNGAYKRVGINTNVLGSEDEGIIIQVVTGLNSSIQTLDAHIFSYSEELTK